MENVFARGSGHGGFRWEDLGDIRTGRGDLGEEVPVLVYRLMQYTMFDVLVRAYGLETASEHFRTAGHAAGMALARSTLDLTVGFNLFISSLQDKLKALKIGILRMEAFNEGDGSITLTVAEDLDCSGLPVTDETVCFYDEGFIAGILEAYTGQRYVVREVDCWANGDRVCRFVGAIVREEGRISE